MYIEKPTQEIPLIPLLNNIPKGPWREWIDSSKMQIADRTEKLKND